jgi:CDP-diacylglycerol--serine O-phosphatidyltransferase
MSDSPVTAPGIPAQTPRRRATDLPRRRPRKGMFILPSLFTSLNIAAGYYAISQTLQGVNGDYWHFDLAAKAIGIAVVADGLDGRIARMTNTTSDFGRELDSLADVITFGVAPAVLAWTWGFRLLPLTLSPALRGRLIQLGAIATFLFLIAGASRLARFNIQKNPQPSNPGRPGKKYFVGMPIPAGAGVIAAVVHFNGFWNTTNNQGGEPLTFWWQAVVWIVIVLLAAFLMVSTWRFYSFKDIDFSRQHRFRVIVLIGGLLAAVWFFSNIVLFILAIVYMLSGVLMRLSYTVRRSRPPQPPPSYKEAPEAQ